jgi:Cu+-exporting ATPase
MTEEKFKVTGMSCAACSARVEKAVTRLDGTSDVSVNLLTGTMRLNRDDGMVSREDIIKAVEKAGYGAMTDEAAAPGTAAKAAGGSVSEEAAAEARRMKLRLILSVVFLIPLMGVSMSHMFMSAGDGEMGRPLTLALVQVLFLIPIVALNFKYFRNGIPSLLRGGPNMDSLIAVGSLAAMIYGTFSIFMMVHGYEIMDMALVHKYGSEVYFESAGTILTLITVGKYLESMSKGKTSQAIEKLMELAPETATVERDGRELTIAIDELRQNDILLVRPGESIAADGVIESGSTTVDESAITGESIPVERKPGDRVISATLNKTGFIRVRCQQVGEDSTISQIIRLVDEASASKAPIARLADKIAGVFVPVVMIIALAAAVIWLIAGATFEFALSTGIAVLVISCPCALGLATPVAIMVGTGKGAENGILIKSGQALETAHSIDTVVLDKTGTITEGRPEVTDVIALGLDEDGLLSLAAAMEKGSEHPLAEAVCAFAEKKELTVPEPESFEAVPGRGVRATVAGREYLAGNVAMMRDYGIETAGERTDELAAQGKTPLLFAEAGSGKLLGIIAAADVEKTTSREAVASFRRMGIDVVMLTGDNRRTADAIGRRLGITRAVAEVLPQDKEKHIAELQQQGHKVAMIGDGINDAPALARADLGIAIGAGTDVAIESADAVLMRSDLLDAVTAIRLSRAVIRNIRENLFWAFFYNVIGIPLAAGVLYPAFGLTLSPMFGAAAMSLSSVCVVTNALRLKLFRTDRQEPAAEINDKEEENNKMKYELKIEGMMCQHCQQHMTEALNKMEGVSAVVDLENGSAAVEADKAVSEAEFAAVTEEAGYTLTGYKEA